MREKRNIGIVSCQQNLLPKTMLKKCPYPKYKICKSKKNKILRVENFRTYLQRRTAVIFIFTCLTLYNPVGIMTTKWCHQWQELIKGRLFWVRTYFWEPTTCLCLLSRNNYIQARQFINFLNKKKIIVLAFHSGVKKK